MANAQVIHHVDCQPPVRVTSDAAIAGRDATRLKICCISPMVAGADPAGGARSTAMRNKVAGMAPPERERDDALSSTAMPTGTAQQLLPLAARSGLVSGAQSRPEAADATIACAVSNTPASSPASSPRAWPADPSGSPMSGTSTSRSGARTSAARTGRTGVRSPDGLRGAAGTHPGCSRPGRNAPSAGPRRPSCRAPRCWTANSASKALGDVGGARSVARAPDCQQSHGFTTFSDGRGGDGKRQPG